MGYAAAPTNHMPRWLAIILGIVSIIIGFLLLRNPGATLLALSTLLGFYFLIIGIMAIIGIFTGSPGSKLWKLIGGVLAIIVAVLLLSRPILSSFATAVAFDWLLAFFLVISGIALLIDGFQGGGFLSIVLGVLAGLFGIWLLFNPLRTVFTLPVALGLIAIIGGIASIIGAIFRKTPEPAPVPEATRAAAIAADVPPAAAVSAAAAGVTAAAVAAKPSAQDVAGEAVDAADQAVAGAADAVSDGAAVVADAAGDVVPEVAQKTGAGAAWVEEQLGVEADIDWSSLQLKMESSLSEGLGPELAERLKAADINAPGDFLKLAASREGRARIASATGIPEGAILRWVNQADLQRIKGVGDLYSALLEAAGVDTVVELSQRNAANLLARLTSTNEELDIAERLPQLSEVEDWIRQAKELPRVVTY